MSKESTRNPMGLSVMRQTLATISNVKSLIGKRIKGRTILWVDDNPGNNRIIHALFKEAGANICLADSTEKAMKILSDPNSDINLIISDMGRIGDPMAGLTLFRLIYQAEITIPRIIYSYSPVAQENIEEILFWGGVGPAVSPEDLSYLISKII